MKNLRFLFYMLAVTSLSLFFTACGEEGDDDDDDLGPDQELVDLTDENAVSEALTIPGATMVEGPLPTPSTEAGAPVLEDAGTTEDIPLTQGSTLVLDASLDEGSAVGVYLQVEGADNYYDIPLTTSSGRILPRGRALQEGTEEVVTEEEVGVSESSRVAVEFELPDNIGTGRFCMEICVYDAENRVSAPIVRCVEINELGGGEAANFLTANAWNVVSFTIEEVLEDGTVEEYTELVGEPFSYTNYFYCPVDIVVEEDNGEGEGTGAEGEGDGTGAEGEGNGESNGEGDGTGEATGEGDGTGEATGEGDGTGESTGEGQGEGDGTNTGGRALQDGDGFNDQFKEFTESYLTAFIKVTLNDDGSLQVIEEGEETSLDWENSTCEEDGLVFIEESYRDVQEGGWSYNEETQELVMVFNLVESNVEDDFEDEGTTIFDAVVRQDGDYLYLESNSPDGPSVIKLVKADD